jgi:hypothetical protein
MAEQVEKVPLIPNVVSPNAVPQIKVTDVGDGKPQKIAMGVAIVAIIFFIATISVFATGNKSKSGVGLMITSIVLFGVAPVVLFAGLQKQEK